MTLRTLVGLFSLVGVIATSTIARADNIEEAKAHFQRGKEAMERADYQSALNEFQKANELAPAPNVLYAIGRAYEGLGRYQDAAFAFEKYLDQYGAPQSDEDKTFQANLRARIAADRERAQSATPAQPPVGQPPPTYPPYQYPQNQYPPNYNYPPQYYPPPYGYAPYQPVRTYQITKADRMLEVRARRNRAIALTAVGVTLNVIGLVLIIDAAVDGHGPDINNNAPDSTYSGANIGEGFVGALLFLPGIIMWPIGAVRYVGATNELRRLAAEPDAPQPTGYQPRAMMFSSPVFRF